MPLICSRRGLGSRSPALAGVALPVRIATGEPRRRAGFDEDLLFTHRGLSGPAVLQISTYWRPGEPLTIDLAPGRRSGGRAARGQGALAAGASATLLAELLPRRLAEAWLQPTPGLAERRVAEPARPRPGALADASAALADRCPPAPRATARPRSPPAASTPASSIRAAWRAGACPGLYFIGEVVDVTGWLGGYNFQWAWASAAACARALDRA